MTDEKVKEAVERVARAICVKMGQEPDDSAPTGMICGRNNEPLPWWRFYEEEAEAAVLALQAERDKLSDLLADRSTELDWERSARLAAEAERDKLSGEVERLKGVLAGQTQAFNEAANNHLASEANRQALAAAYEQGCIDTHKAIQSEPELALMSVEHAEFGEAASDYAAAFQSRQEESL